MRKWVNTELYSMLVTGEVCYELKRRGIKYERSEMGGHWYHIEVYCNAAEMAEINDCIDWIVDRACCSPDADPELLKIYHIA